MMKQTPACFFFSTWILISVSHSNYGGSDVPMAPSKEQQTLMWQQNSYLVDSGINSGAATQVIMKFMCILAICHIPLGSCKKTVTPKMAVELDSG